MTSIIVPARLFAVALGVATLGVSATTLAAPSNDWPTVGSSIFSTHESFMVAASDGRITKREAQKINQKKLKRKKKQIQDLNAELNHNRSLTKKRTVRTRAEFNKLRESRVDQFKADQAKRLAKHKVARETPAGRGGMSQDDFDEAFAADENAEINEHEFEMGTLDARERAVLDVEVEEKAKYEAEHKAKLSNLQRELSKLQAEEVSLK
ncbi:MAG: hypothetical protein K0U93_17270 [Gammaproteobacteria bacterium]|nr:hypothetical protein [Gammaproteobacteria bacterium]